MTALIVEDAFMVRERVVITGRVREGEIRAGAQMLLDVAGVRHPVRVMRIEVGFCTRGVIPESAVAGSNVGLTIDGLTGVALPDLIGAPLLS